MKTQTLDGAEKKLRDARTIYGETVRAFINRDETVKKLRLDAESVRKALQIAEANARADAANDDEVKQAEKLIKDRAHEVEAIRRRSEFPERVREFIAGLCAGVDWSGRWHLLWNNERFCILTKKSGSYWSNQIDGHKYAGVYHHLFDMDKFSPAVKQWQMGTRLAEAATLRKQDGGRLSAATRKDWQQMAEFLSVETLPKEGVKSP